VPDGWLAADWTANGSRTQEGLVFGISGMKDNERHWGGEISIISQNFPKSPSILYIHLNPPFPKQGRTVPAVNERAARGADVEVLAGDSRSHH
jgi:hypothetical protein